MTVTKFAGNFFSNILSACLYNDYISFNLLVFAVDQLIRQYVMWERTTEKKYTLVASDERKSLMYLKLDKQNVTLFLIFFI